MCPMPVLRAVVPAAGGGARMGAAVPKQYLDLAGRPLAEHTLRALLGVTGISEIVVALAQDDAHWQTLAPALRARVRTIEGGARRAQSVLNALESLAGAAEDDWVLVHDMARPCVRAADIERLGFRSKLIEGGAHNIKVTVPADIALAEFLLEGRV